VLAQAQTLFGKNLYNELVHKLSKSSVKNSLQFKIKEYLWRLRKMVIEEPPSLYFRKYALRLLKDVLLYNEILSYDNINTVDDKGIILLFISAYK